MIRPLELIASARQLATPGHERSISDADVRRAISTAYYAMFHAVAAAAADQVVGVQSGGVSASWAHVYRAIDHSTIKRACMNSELRRAFAPDIASFAVMFETMQTKRHKADYDPRAVFSPTSAMRDIDDVERILVLFVQASDEDLKAFLAFALFKPRT